MQWETNARKVTSALKEQLYQIRAPPALSKGELVLLSAKHAQLDTTAKMDALVLSNAKTDSALLEWVHHRYVQTVLMVPRVLRNWSQQTTVPTVLTGSGVQAVLSEEPVMLVTSVTLEPLHGVMITRFVKKVITALLEPCFQSGALRLSTLREPVRLTFPSVSLAKLVTTALIMIQYPVFVQRVTSVRRRLRNLFHAGKVPTMVSRKQNQKINA
jgi:hypothetical protein